jgi:putative AdoMet-dependent methyltransferase
MKERLVWQYDEFKQVGRDYSAPAEVALFDSSHSDFRDIAKESRIVLDSLGIGKDNVLIDFGSGTGTFAIQAALRGAKVYAVDVSQAMLDYAQAKAVKEGISNIIFRHGGFLTFELEDQTANAIVTTFAFHHLPDFWKGIALTRMYRMLRPGGQLYIHDAILEEHHAIENVAAFIEKLADAGGDSLRTGTEGHFREEFSTYDWIMDGLLERAGFTIQRKKIQDGVTGTYYCTKNS